MKIIAISDMHGKLPIISERFDILLICGDIFCTSHGNTGVQENWLRTKFVRWVNRLNPASDESRIVLIGGNHDYLFYERGYYTTVKMLSRLHFRIPVVYLENCEETLSIRGRKCRIYGTPNCKKYGSHAFMDGNLERIYGMIPEGLDILLSHDAADMADLGVISSGRRAGVNAGNRYLSERIREVRPSYYFCGHIHSGNHVPVTIDGTTVCNVSVLGEDYKPAYKPLSLTI